MKSTREILRGYYFRLLKKLALWGGLVALILSSLIAAPASAYVNQVTSRSATLTNTKPGATANVTIGWTSAAGAFTTKGIKFEMCTSPLQTTSCTASNSSDFSTASSTLGGQTGISGFAESNKTTTEYDITNGTGTSLNSTAVTVTINGLTLPNVANTQFYFRVTTYGDTGLVTPSANGEDFGGMATSTGTEISVNANVQESLQFTVGATGTCGGISGSSVNIGSNPGTDNVLEIGTATAGTSVMCVNTNASSGYSLQYVSNSSHNNAFTNGAYDIADNSSGATFATPWTNSTDFFGINLRANTGANHGPTAGADPSVAPTSYGSGYGTADSYAFAHGTPTTIASYTTGPIGNTLYTVTYAAIAGSATKTGAYQVKMNYIATGTF